MSKNNSKFQVARLEIWLPQGISCCPTYAGFWIYWSLCDNLYVYDIYIYKAFYCLVLTHWGRVTHICISKLTIICSDNGLLPGCRQAIIWTNAGILLIGPLGTYFSEISIEIHTLSFMKMCWKMISEKWRPFYLCLNAVQFHPFVVYFLLCLSLLSLHCVLTEHSVTATVAWWYPVEFHNKQGKSEGFDSCDRPSNLAQIWSKSSIFQPVWPWNLMDDLEK